MKKNIFTVFLSLTATIFIITGTAFSGGAPGPGMLSDTIGALKKTEKHALEADLLKIQNTLPSTSKEKGMSKILGVFEKKIDDQRVLARVRLKLDSVDDNRLHMITSLSDKIDRDAGIGDTIAFFLLTAMVIFS